MSKTNSLTSHTPQNSSHRVDKMSGMTKGFKETMIGVSKKIIKHITNKKRRQHLKDTDKI